MFGYQMTTGRRIANAMQMVVLITRKTMKAMGVVDAESGGRRAFTTRVLANRRQRVMYL